MCYLVYIIYSQSTDTFYKGQTKNLSERLSRHNKGFEKATRHGVPWDLVWCADKSSRSSAINLERKLKNLSRQKLLDFIIKYDTWIAGPDALTATVRGQGADR